LSGLLWRQNRQVRINAAAQAAATAPVRVEPYLFFDGNCEDALAFYSRCLGGAVVDLQRYRGSPMESQLPAAWRDKVMHAKFEADGYRFMASDRTPGQPFGGHAGYSMAVNVPGDPVRGEQVFRALATGGLVTMPFATTFWGAHFGMLVDKFGVGWMVNCEMGGGPPN
jgi:PhnB protein